MLVRDAEFGQLRSAISSTTGCLPSQPFRQPHLPTPMIVFLRLAACVLAISANAAIAASAGAVAQIDGTPYTLPGTVVHTIHAKQLNRDYQVYISLPSSYSPNGPPLPVVFVTDADYAFPLVRAITARVGGHSKAISPFVLVGLSYAIGDTGTYSRNRDYTPTIHYGQQATSDMPGRKPIYGEGDGYRRFLKSDVLPFVAQRYKVDWSRSMFVGHSYGSLLGTQILLTSPQMFSRYVLSSPSLWYDQRIMFSREKEYAATHKDMKANVFFAVGGLERPCEKSDKFGSACDKDDDMVGDVLAFDAALRSHHYPGLRTQLHVYKGFDHLNVFPDMITDALKWLTADH
jgi:predicted alpha/beta superfamily hydrolase